MVDRNTDNRGPTVLFFTGCILYTPLTITLSIIDVPVLHCSISVFTFYLYILVFLHRNVYLLLHTLSPKRGLHMQFVLIHIENSMYSLGKLWFLKIFKNFKTPLRTKFSVMLIIKTFAHAVMVLALTAQQNITLVLKTVIYILF